MSGKKCWDLYKGNVRFTTVADIRAVAQGERMAIDDLSGVEVASGTYFYDGTVPQRVSVIARNYDVWWSTYAADGLLEEGEKPAKAGPDGLYYYVSSTGPFTTPEEAKAWAEKSCGPIEWSAERTSAFHPLRT
ncbi:MAG: hypothetical protein AB7V46_13415 [Thermomicrobiales bacterium]